MSSLQNHPQFTLNDDAAHAFDQIENRYGLFIVNSATRTLQQQQNLIDRWNRGGPANRPPNLYQPATPANTSAHVHGNAIDIANWQDFAPIAEPYGFAHPYAYDPVHFEYHPTLQPAENTVTPLPKQNGHKRMNLALFGNHTGEYSLIWTLNGQTVKTPLSGDEFARYGAAGLAYSDIDPATYNSIPNK